MDIKPHFLDFSKLSSRENRNKAYRNKTIVPPANRQNVKQDVVDKEDKTFSIGKLSPRPVLFDYTRQEEFPNSDLEKVWWDGSKIGHQDQTPEAALKLYSPLSVLEVKPKEKMQLTEEELTSRKKLQYKNKTYNVSSFGLNYWDPKKIPDKNDHFWPPIPKRTDSKAVANYNFEKQTSKQNILKMSHEVNEKRFNQVDKDPKYIYPLMRSPSVLIQKEHKTQDLKFNVNPLKKFEPTQETEYFMKRLIDDQNSQKEVINLKSPRVTVRDWDKWRNASKFGDQTDSFLEMIEVADQMDIIKSQTKEEKKELQIIARNPLKKFLTKATNQQKVVGQQITGWLNQSMNKSDTKD